MNPKSIEVIIETPKGCRNKFRYDQKRKCFKLGSVLPAGMSFPYDFGFVPGTVAEDGDPLDILVMMDEAAFPGCRLDIRIIGIIEAEQSDDNETLRNDRLIGVATEAHDYADIVHIDDMNEQFLDELEKFFVSYNKTRGKLFRLIGTHGPKRAMKILRSQHTRQKPDREF